MTRLSIRELEQKDAQRAKTNHETYKMIYNLCANHIRRQHGTGNTFTLYAVPTFVIGRTPYVHSHAVRYTVEKLERGGFTVHTDEKSPGVLLVDWTKTPQPQRQEQASQKSSPKKKKKTRKEKSKPRKIQEPLNVRIARLQSKSIMNA